MTIIEHEMPMLAEDAGFPRADDERIQPFLHQCREQGIIDDAGKMLRHATIFRGMRWSADRKRFWTIRVECREMAKV